MIEYKMEGISLRNLVRPTNDWRELLETLGGAMLLSVFIMVIIARAFTVEGLSMQPTLYNGERVLVDKISYRFMQPARGEIIVFKYPTDPKQHFIKRIVAVSGDTVEVIDGKVFVNNQEVVEDFISDPARYGFSRQIVPAEHYFVLGDNRNNSEDSRDKRVGFVPRDLVVGRAIWRYWPLNRMSIIRKPQLFGELLE